MAIFNVRDFGAVGNGRDDDFPAFQRAFDALGSAFRPSRLIGGGGVLFIPTGEYKLTQTLVVKTGTIMQGCGSGASALRFDGPDPSGHTTIAGIAIDFNHSSIRDLSVATDKPHGYDPNIANALTPPEPEIAEDERNFPDGISHSGIVIRAAQVSVENCFVNGFEHDGIHINSAISKIEPHGWQVRNCLIQENGRHGLFASGAIGGGCAMRVECATNRKYGFYDQSQSTGNTYIAGIVETNGVAGQFGGGYHISNSQHVLLDCGDGDPAFDTVIYPTSVFGGAIGQMTRDGHTGGAYPLDIFGGNEFPAVFYSGGDFSAPGVRSNGVHPWNQSNTILDGRFTMILAASNALPANESRLEIRLPDTTILNVGRNLRGYQVTVKKVNGSKPVVILPPSGQQIDDLSEVTLTAMFSWVTVLWGLDTWHIIGRG